MAFVDLHSHVLAGLDDGSPDLATSVAMVEALTAIGFDDICATPHQKAGQFLPTSDDIGTAYAALQAAVAGKAVARLHLGAENMWDDVFFGRSQAGAIPSYDGGPAFLFELRPSELPLGLTEHLFKLRMQGKLPVLAHPERYQPLWDAPEILDRLRQEVALVVDLGAIAGYHGRREGKVARQLVEDGLAHAVASDAHSLSDVKVAAEGIAWIEKKLGAAAVERLLDEAPRAILAGDLPD